jgi:hypothetical protein
LANQAVEDLRDDADECYVDDVADNKPGNKLRSTNGFTEIFIIVMTLALNELLTKNDSMSSNDQCSLMKVLCANWVDLLVVDYPHLAAHMTKVKFKKDQLKSMIESDSGKNLLRKAKLAVSLMNNHLASSWVEPMQGPSGKGRDGSQNFAYNFGAATTLFHFLCILHLMLIADVLQ